MAHYIHHVPGRLRVKSGKLKRNDKFGRIVEERLAGMEGVLSVELRLVTGSMVVLYDTELASSRIILDALLDMSIERQVVASVQTGSRLGDKLLSKAVETLIERSAMALIAALI